MIFILNTCQTFVSDPTLGAVGRVSPTLALEWYPEEAAAEPQEVSD